MWGFQNERQYYCCYSTYFRYFYIYDRGGIRAALREKSFPEKKKTQTSGQFGQEPPLELLYDYSLPGLVPELFPSRVNRPLWDHTPTPEPQDPQYHTHWEIITQKEITVFAFLFRRRKNECREPYGIHYSLFTIHSSLWVIYKRPCSKWSLNKYQIHEAQGKSLCSQVFVQSRNCSFHLCLCSGSQLDTRGHRLLPTHTDHLICATNHSLVKNTVSALEKVSHLWLSISYRKVNFNTGAKLCQRCAKVMWDRER